MFEALLKILPLTAKAFQWLLTQNDKERERFASLCERISEQLEGFAKASDDQRQSRNLCAELRVYVPEIEEIANGILTENQLKSMARELNSVCDAWSKHSEKVEKGLHITDSDLYEVQDAAGHFRGLAKLVRTL
jgi:hypothetical protein